MKKDKIATQLPVENQTEEKSQSAITGSQSQTSGSHGNQASSRSKIFRRLAAASALCSLFTALLISCEQDPDPQTPLPTYKPPTEWTAVDYPFEESVRRLAFGNGVFVATGDRSGAWYSADGISWTASSEKDDLLAAPGTGNTNLGGFTFGGGYFLTTGSSSGNTTRAWSTDGNVWTASGDGINCKGVTWGNGVFMTGGSGGRIAYSSAPENPASWTLIGPEITTFELNETWKTNGYINGMAFGNNTFLAVGSSFGHAAYSKNNGASWTAITQTEQIFALSHIGWINSAAYGAGRFVAGGDGGGKMAYSESNPELWTQVADSKLSGAIHSITYAAGYFVAGDAGGNLSYSADGVRWSAVSDPKVSGNISGIAYGKGRWVIVTSDRDAAYSIVE